MKPGLPVAGAFFFLRLAKWLYVHVCVFGVCRGVFKALICCPVSYTDIDLALNCLAHILFLIILSTFSSPPPSYILGIKLTGLYICCLQ